MMQLNDPDFWDRMEKYAEQAKALPDWMKGSRENKRMAEEHKYRTPEYLEGLRSMVSRGIGCLPSEVVYILSDIEALRAELQRTQKERDRWHEAATNNATELIALAEEKDAEIARLREDYDKAVTKLGAEMVAKARVENKLDRMRKALKEISTVGIYADSPKELSAYLRDIVWCALNPEQPK